MKVTYVRIADGPGDMGLIQIIFREGRTSNRERGVSVVPECNFTFHIAYDPRMLNEESTYTAIYHVALHGVLRLQKDERYSYLLIGRGRPISCLKEPVFPEGWLAMNYDTHSRTGSAWGLSENPLEHPILKAMHQHRFDAVDVAF